MIRTVLPFRPKPANLPNLIFDPIQDLWQRSPWAIRIATTLWVAMLLGIAGRVAFSKPTSQSVVPIYLAAGERWLASDSLYRYDYTSPIDVYRNPPGVAALFVPFTFLPERTAALLWRAAMAGVFLTGLIRFRRAVAPNLNSTRTGWFYGIAAILSLPAVNNGQVNWLIAAACLHAVADFRHERWRGAAAWLAFAAWLKVYPLALGMLAILYAPRALGPRWLAYSLIAFALPFVAQHSEYVVAQYREFAAAQMADDRTYADPVRVQRDWTVLSRTWLGWVPPPTVTKSVSVLAGIAFAGICLALMSRERQRPEQAAFLLLLGSTWMTLFGPATEMNTYSLLAASAALLAVQSRAHRGIQCLAFVGVALLLVTVLRGAFPQDWRFTLLGPQALGAVLLFLVGLWDVATHTPIATTAPVESTILTARIAGHPAIRRTEPLPLRENLAENHPTSRAE